MPICKLFHGHRRYRDHLCRIMFQIEQIPHFHCFVVICRIDFDVIVNYDLDIVPRTAIEDRAMPMPEI